jgi:hypothetical protein
LLNLISVISYVDKPRRNDFDGTHFPGKLFTLEQGGGYHVRILGRVARQRVAKYIPKATNTQATVEELPFL